MALRGSGAPRGFGGLVRAALGLAFTVFLLGLPGPAAAQGQRTPEPSEWDRADYRVLSGKRADDLEPMTPQGDEKLDRVTTRVVGPGSYALLDLLGLPRRDVAKETRAKVEKLLEVRRSVSPEEGKDGDFTFDLGLGEPVAAETPVGGEKPSEKEFHIISSEFLEVDVENLKVYGTRRSRVTFGRYQIEADRMQIDVRLREVHVAGNAILREDQGGVELHADSFSFSFRHFVGRGENIRGERAEISFFGSDLQPLPTFAQENERDIFLLDASLTGCDFEMPHYRIQGSEIIFIREDRLFIFHAVIYLREFPIAYLPVFSRSLDEDRQWNIYWGYSTSRPRDHGAFGILSYDYYYKELEPNPVNDAEYLRRSFGRFRPSVYYFDDAQGVGLDATYDFNYGRHKGDSFVWFAPDDEGRELGTDERAEEEAPVEGEVIQPVGDSDEDNAGQRYIVDLKHRSEVLPDLDLLLNVDWLSDSEVYHDFFDEFTENERGRVFERDALAALQYRSDNWLARLKVSVTERITRNRLTNPTEAGDNDNDFIANPDNTMSFISGLVGVDEELEGLDPILDDEPLADGRFDREEEDQINNRRFRPVSERLPEFNLTTSRIKLSTLPLYWTLDLRAFNNLDKGLNHFDDADDSTVRGFDLYNSLGHTIVFNDHYSWTNQIGVGGGLAEREDKEWKVFETIDRPEVFPSTINNIKFVDDSTLLVGTREASLRDVDDEFFYADYQSRFDARFSEEWTGNVTYTIREGSDDSLWEYYEGIGGNGARKDIYDYRPLVHRIQGAIDYEGLYPRVKASLSGGVNLQGEEDIYANEVREFAAASLGWTSLDDVWDVSASAVYANYQIRDPTDEFAYESATTAYVGQIDYFPNHERYWARLKGVYFESLDEDPLNDEIRAQVENDPFLGDVDDIGTDLIRYQVEGILGFKVGPKWEIELQARYDDEEEDFDRLSLVFLRDLHDATLIFRVNWELERVDDDEDLDNDGINDTADEGAEFERELSYDIGLTFALPNSDRTVGRGSRATVRSRRQTEAEYGG